jgi:hypothetical protein
MAGFYVAFWHNHELNILNKCTSLMKKSSSLAAALGVTNTLSE